jgi:hypothetical protein
MTGRTRARAATLSGRALVGAGCAVLAIYVALLGFAYSGNYISAHSTSGGTVYVNGASRRTRWPCGPPLTLEPLRPSGRSRGQADGLCPQSACRQLRQRLIDHEIASDDDCHRTSVRSSTPIYNSPIPD